MAVDMSGAIIPKDISICSVVEEIARQIDHFTRELVDLRVEDDHMVVHVVIFLQVACLGEMTGFD